MINGAGQRFGTHESCWLLPTWCPHAYCEPQDDADLDGADVATLLDAAFEGNREAVDLIVDHFGDRAVWPPS